MDALSWARVRFLPLGEDRTQRLKAGSSSSIPQRANYQSGRHGRIIRMMKVPRQAGAEVPELPIPAPVSNDTMDGPVLYCRCRLGST